MLKKGSPYAGQTKILKRSPAYGMPPVVVTSDMTPALKAKLRSAFLAMHKTATGKAILNAMMIDGLLKFPKKL